MICHGHSGQEEDMLQVQSAILDCENMLVVWFVCVSCVSALWNTSQQNLRLLLLIVNLILVIKDADHQEHLASLHGQRLQQSCQQYIGLPRNLLMSLCHGTLGDVLGV